MHCTFNTPYIVSMHSTNCETINSMIEVNTRLAGVARNKGLGSANVGGDLFSKEELEALLLGPEIQGMWYNSLDRMREAANDLAETEDAEYGSAVHKEDSEWAAVFGEGGFIYTVNYQARVDNEYHNTLWEVLGLAAKYIEEAIASGGGQDLGNGYTYDARGKGSTVRGPDGRYAALEGVTRGGPKELEE
jgi:hypothetical protein